MLCVSTSIICASLGGFGLAPSVPQRLLLMKFVFPFITKSSIDTMNKLHVTLFHPISFMSSLFPPSSVESLGNCQLGYVQSHISQLSHHDNYLICNTSHAPHRNERA